MKTGHRLETDRLIIRPFNLNQNDRNFFYRVDSDEEMMRFFPWRSSTQEAEAKLVRIVEMGKKSGLTWAMASLKNTGEPIGFTGLWQVTFDAPFTPAVEIGWRYVPEHWGKGYATEGARELLRHAFEDLNLPSIVSFAVEQNRASINVMGKIGMTEDPMSPFMHNAVPDTHQHLKRHVLYRINNPNKQR